MSLLGSLSVSILGNSVGLSNSLTGAQKQIQDFGKNMQSVGRNLTTIGSSLTKMLTVPIVAIGGTSLKAAISFESAFAGVRKTVDATENEFAKFKKGIIDMSKELPPSANEIAKVAEVAGQLGIENKSLLSFTKTMVNLGVATNMSSEEASASLARLANITQMPQKNFDRLGSTVVALGNNFATTESEIVDMGLRLAGVGKQVGMSENQILALATAMSSVGINAEAGGTAMSMVMKKIQNAVSNGGVKLQNFAKIAGMSATDFQKAWEGNAASALDAVIQGLGDASNRGENLNGVLGELGITGIRESDTMLRLAGASDSVTKALDLSSKAWDENTALTNEASERYQTMESQLKIMWNRIKAIGITIGEALVPALSNTLKALEPVIKLIEKLANWFKNLNPTAQTTIIMFGGFLAVIGPILMYFGLLFSSIGSIATGFAGLSKGFVGAGKSAGLFGGIIGKLTSPFGMLLGLFLRFLPLIITFISKNETAQNAIKNLGGVFSKLSPIFEKVTSIFSEAISTLGGSISNVFSKIMPTVEKVLTTLINVADSLLKAIVPIFNNLINFGANLLVSLLPVFLTIVGVVAKLFKELSPVFDEFAKMFEELAPVFVETGEVINQSIKDLQPSFEELVTAFGELIEVLGDMFKEIVPMLADLIKTLLPVLADTFKQVFEMIVEVAKTVIPIVVDLIKQIVPLILDIVENILPVLLEVVQTVFPVILEVIQTVIPIVLSLIQEIVPIIMGIVEVVLPVLLQVVQTVFPIILGIIQSVIPIVILILQSVVKIITGVLVPAIEIILKVVQIVFPIIMNVIQTAIAIITGIIKLFTAVLKGDWSGAWDAVKSIFSATWGFLKSSLSGFIDGFVSIFRTIKDKITNIWDKVVEFFKEIDLKKIGKDIIQGLINGLGSMAGAVTDKVKSIATGIKDTITGFLGIKSPSRVLMQIGEWTGEGLLIGLEGMIKPIQKVSDNLALSAIPDIAGIDELLSFDSSNGLDVNHNVNYDDSEFISLLKEISSKIGGDLYIGEEKMGSFIDGNQANRLGMRRRRVVFQ